MSDESQPHMIDGATNEDLGNVLGLLPKLTTVTLKVGEHTEGHIATLLGHLQKAGVAANAIRVSGEFDAQEWLEARQYSWTKFFEVDDIEAYISECEEGRGLQFSFGAFTLVSVADHAALASLVAQLSGGLSENDINISRTNKGGNIYTCSFSPLQTVEFNWEEMNEESSEFDCSSLEEWEKFTEMISNAGLSLCPGFFYNEWSGNQVDQEEWYFSNFDFPSPETITLNWAP